MLDLKIGGFGNFNLQYAVFDYNGTLARDGNLLPHVGDRLLSLSQKLSVIILTADTFGKVREQCATYPFRIHIIDAGKEADQKSDFVRELGAETVIAFGNGHNDVDMLKAAAIGISILESEGMYTEAILAANICVRDICEGIDLLLNPLRLLATLRT